MKKKVVRSIILLLITCLIYACQFTGRHEAVDVDQILKDYLNGEVIVSVEQAYEMYDSDTTGVVFLDVRSSIAFEKIHEPGAINLPASQIRETKLKDLPRAEESIYLVYSDRLNEAMDAWFALKWIKLPNVKMIRGSFDGEIGMLMEVGESSIDYGAEIEKAKDRLTLKTLPPPPLIAPKKKVVPKKKKVVKEEEEGC